MVRKLALILALGCMAPACHPAQRVSVGELEHFLAESQSLPDGELAAKLSDLQLTERFSSARLVHWRSTLAGGRAQRALIGLADRSAFLALPASDALTLAAPDIAEQRRILGLAAAYVSKAIPQLPRFYSSQSTIRFEGAPGSVDAAGEGDAIHAVRVTHTNVLYRDGQEVVEPLPAKLEKSHGPEQGLKTWGVFGPVLGLVLVDAAQNRLGWGYWEQGSDGPVAVFRYAVAKAKSHYEVRYCCVTAAYGMEINSFQQMSGYHGEIAVNPSTGTILRLTLEAELGPQDPITRGAIAVEYGPVELGGTTYICPVRSVSISVTKTLRRVQDPEGHMLPAMGPPQLLVNHIDFEKYHLFRAETRVLSGDEERTAGLAPDATLPRTEPADLPPSEEELADAPATKPAPASAASGASEAGLQDSPPAGDAPEISTTAATGLPETPAQPTEPQNATPSGLTFRLNARLVDVNVVAFDKKGRPITDLKPENLELYDNGVKQNVTSFSRADSDVASAPPAATLAPPPAPATDAKAFSNHAAKQIKPTDGEGNTIILLVDGSNLSFPDVADARQQMLRFLKSLPANERVALYAMRYHGYQVLQEATSDHAAVASFLSKWMPTAQDMANAQDEEQRNRQQIETVHSPEDMLSVNGNYTLDTGAQTEALDPKLRELGSHPGEIAMAVLVQVAHHLGALPGHKSLVWITSDNVLVDWNQSSMTIEKGSKYIEPIALRTQEAMNNAHVSVYPLDASRLEAAVTNADIGTRRVELTPTFQKPPSTEQAQEGPEATSGLDMNAFTQGRDIGSGGRLTAQMQQDLRPIQSVYREVAEATGGRALRRSSDIVGELNGIAADGRATYLLGFSPGQPADGQYHRLTVKVAGRKDVQVRYRTGYKYDREPTTIKERFAQTVWQPVDASEIGLVTKPITDAAGSALRVTVAGSDLNLSPQSAAKEGQAEQHPVWTGKLDIFLVQRDAVGQHAKVTGQTVGLRLKPETYQRAMNEGLTFDERLEPKLSGSSLRVVVVDVNTGRMGSVTVPVTALAKP